jgi:glycosyltransferase involved in cell wall biosynthesis
MDAEGKAEGKHLKVLYLSPSPAPRVRGTDGLFADIECLREHFGGDLISLSPVRHLLPLIPANLYGMHLIPALQAYNREVDIIHLFFPRIVNFRILRYLSKPIIYSVISGLDEKCLPRAKPHCTVVVSSFHEVNLLRSHGYYRVNAIRPGIDLSGIHATPPVDAEPEFVLLAGSAPWTRRQFETKGFDLLLKVLTQLPKVRLISLWRGALYREWSERVKSFGLADRVEIIQEKADISMILSRCHVAVVLSSTSDQVKSYPNSLMEALAAGRPILVSRSNPMSYYVENRKCGKVVENLCLEEVTNAITEIMDKYSAFTRAASLAGRDLSATKMIENYQHLYEEVIKQTAISR